MKTLKIIAGLTWAFACLIFIIMLFPSLNPLANKVSMYPFMKINPNYSGGEIVRELNKENYTISIHRTVFDGLVCERKNGFVQIDWRGKLPRVINDTIDFDNDNSKDFIVGIDTTNAKSKITALNSKVRDIEISTKTSFGWAIRVGLVK